MIRFATLAALWMLAANAPAAWPPLEPLDVDRLERAGLRVVRTNHCEMVTDLPPSEQIDRLPRLVDLALPQLADRFGTGRGAPLAEWRLRVGLVGERSRFESAGLWPDRGGEFENGQSLGYRAWLYDQPSDYYRRCLLLHEVTHSYMSTRLGSCGPGWYMEATAELCGAHSWDADGERLEIAAFPPSREASPHWGRVKLVRQAVEAGAEGTVAAVMRIDNRRALDPTAYAWVWAMARFLDDHPRYRDRFRALPRWVNADNFNQRFDRAYSSDRKRLEQEWRLFTHTLQYGHGVAPEAIDWRDGSPLGAGERTVRVAADRGWQSSGVRVEAGRVYRLRAGGRFVIGAEPDGAPWPCEPGGVTLDYHAGRPLGELLATVDTGSEAFVRPTPIGVSARYVPGVSGTLYLRLNDRPNRLAENRGEATVRVAPDG